MIATVQQEKDSYLGEHGFGNDFPFSYQSIRIESGSRPIGFRFSKSITEISATLGNQEIIVCGESDKAEIGFDKAISELIERSALLTYGSIYRSTTSNGWAAHPDRDQCKSNAILEIVERDAVLAHWYTSTPFIEISKQEIPLDIQAWVLTELQNSEYPILRLLVSTAGLGPSITCVLMNNKGYGVSANATKETISDSIASAVAEACRAAHAAIRRSHWQDSLTLKLGEHGSVDPSAHALYYAYHEKFPNWMFGAIEPYAEIKTNWYSRLKACLEDRRFSYQQVMNLPTNVGFARHPLALELRWQTTVPELVQKENGFKRLNLKPESINGKPHIVS